MIRDPRARGLPLRQPTTHRATPGGRGQGSPPQSLQRRLRRVGWRGCGRRHRMPRCLLGRARGSVEVRGDHGLSRILFCKYSREPVDCLPPRRVPDLSLASAAASDARACSPSRSHAATSFVSSVAVRTGLRVGPRARSRSGPRADPRTGPSTRLRTEPRTGTMMRPRTG